MHHVKPVVSKKDGKKRSGRGFSIDEIKKVGLNLAEAKTLEIPIDRRRKTVYDQNVDSVRAYVEKKKAEAKPKQKPQSQLKKKAKK